MSRRHSRHGISEDELIERYAYVLGNVPTSVADKAYATALLRLSPEQRDELVDELRANVPDAPEAAACVVPDGFAALMRDLRARDALVRSRHLAPIAAGFISSPATAAYFISGVGSVDIDKHPAWLQELAGHVSAPVDGGRVNHRKGVNSGVWFGA